MTRTHVERIALSALCIALATPAAWAQEPVVEASLPAYRKVAEMAGALRGNSTAEMRDLMRPWREGFQRIYPRVRIDFDDASFENMGNRPASSGPWLGRLRGYTRERFEKRFGFAPTEVPVCWYVFTVYVHRDNPLRRALTMKEVETVFSRNCWDVTWGDLGIEGKWSERPIKPCAPRRAFLTSLLRPLSVVGTFNFKDPQIPDFADAGVLQRVARDPERMGMASLGFRIDGARPLPIVFGADAKPIHPTIENARSGTYPLARRYFLVLNHNRRAGVGLDPPQREFLRYILSRDGQRVVRKAGYTPLSASEATLALAELGLVPSGEDSPWDRMITGLRLRRLSQNEMDRIERSARKIGSKTTCEELASFTKMLAATGLSSTVAFESDRRGATIRYRLVGDRDAPIQTATNAKARMRIGLYYMWTERDGRATSPKNAFFQIAREQERIKISEKR